MLSLSKHATALVQVSCRTEHDLKCDSPSGEGGRIVFIGASELASSFDRLRMRLIFLCGKKKEPHGSSLSKHATALVQVSRRTEHDFKCDSPAEEEGAAMATICNDM